MTKPTKSKTPKSNPIPTPTKDIADHLLSMKESEILIPNTITNPILESIYRDEILALQRAIRKLREMGSDMNPELLAGILMGFETALRRIEERDDIEIRIKE